MQRERVTLSADQGSDRAARSDDNGGNTDVRHLLARMSDAADFDCLSFFFHSLEITFNLNGVVKCMWPKLLSTLLYSRTKKCYAHLKLDEVTDYENVKEVILDSYLLSARTYLSNFKSARRTGGDTYMIFLN